MSSPKTVQAKKSFPSEKKLVNITTYLISKGYKPGQIPAMIESAKPKRVATLEEWEKIFANY